MCIRDSIGAILTPQLRGTASKIDQSLPYASSLCGACFDVCPVRIPIPDILVHLRTRVVDEHRKGLPTAEAAAMKAMEKVFADHRRLEAAQKAATASHRFFGNRRTLGALPWPMTPWSSARDTPVPPAETFREWWKRERDNTSGDEAR